MEGKNPRVSIITTVYNIEKYLRESLDSVLNQTYRDWELILIDDGATDGSPAICDEYAEKDSRIRLTHKPNSGLADSRNVGLGQAKGEFIAFLDSDDWYDPDMLRYMVDALDTSGADIAICGIFKDYQNKSRVKAPVKKTKTVSRDKALELILKDKKVCSFVWDKMFRREVITEKMTLRMYEDYATVYKWVVNAGSVVLCDKPLYHYRQRAGSIDHHVNPARNMDFFKAEQERYEFITSKGLLPKDHNHFRNRVLRIGLNMAKEISRSGLGNEEILPYIQEIRETLKKYLPADLRHMKIRDYFRIRKLLANPEGFIKSMQRAGHYRIESKKEFFAK